jgi:hypothetical protein
MMMMMASLGVFLSTGCCLVLVLLCSGNPASATRIVRPDVETGTIKVSEGESVTLVCVSNETMIWKASGVQIHPIADRVDIVEANSTQAGAETVQNTLTFRNLLPMVNSGSYECLDASDILAQDMSHVDVKVVHAAKLQITPANTNITGSPRLEVGDDLMLQCVGKYRSQPTWKHEGVVLVEKPGSITITDATDSDADTKTSLLTRSNMTKSAAGSYQCVDNSVYQTNSDSFAVCVGSHAFKTAASSVLVALAVAFMAASNRLLN